MSVKTAEGAVQMCRLSECQQARPGPSEGNGPCRRCPRWSRPSQRCCHHSGRRTHPPPAASSTLAAPASICASASARGGERPVSVRRAAQRGDRQDTEGEQAPNARRPDRADSEGEQDKRASYRTHMARANERRRGKGFTTPCPAPRLATSILYAPLRHRSGAHPTQLHSPAH